MSDYVTIQPSTQRNGGSNPSLVLISVPATAPTQGTLPAGIPAVAIQETVSTGLGNSQGANLSQYYVNTTTRKIRAKRKRADGQPPKADARKLRLPNENTMVKLKNILEANPYNYSGREQYDSWCEVVRASRPVQTDDDGNVIRDEGPVTATDVDSLKALVRRHLDDFSQRHVRRTGTEEEWKEWDDIMESIKKYSEGVPLKVRNPEKAAREAGLKARLDAVQLGMQTGVKKNTWDETSEQMESQDNEMEMGLTDHPDDLAADLHFDADEMVDFHLDGTATAFAGSRSFRIPGTDLQAKIGDDVPSPSSDTTEIVDGDLVKTRGKDRIGSSAGTGSPSSSAAPTIATSGALKSARSVHRKQITEQVRLGRVASGRNQMMQTFSSMSRTVDRMEVTERDEKVTERREREKDRAAERDDREKERILKAKLAEQELLSREKDREERMKKDDEDRKEREQIRAQQLEMQKIEFEMRNKQTEMMLQLISKFVTGKE